MKIKKVEVNRHPNLGKFSIEFDVGSENKMFNLFIGQNGCGKTQLLELIFDFLENGWYPRNDNIDRKLTVIFSDAEMAELEIDFPEVRFEYDGDRPNDWGGLHYFRADNNRDVTHDLHEKVVQRIVQKIFRKVCRYSPVEINFKHKKIEAVKATKLDEEEAKIKSTPELATEIAQLLVDIQNQDAQEALKREQENTGKGISYERHEGRFDRFRKAYSKMFAGKNLKDVVPDGGEHSIIFEDTNTGSTFSLQGLSSGEKQVVYRVGYLLSNLGNIQGGVVLIDEPELSLHPAWQKKYLAFLEEIFLSEDGCKTQFFIATHSPYVVQGANFNKTRVYLFRRSVDNITVIPVENTWSLLAIGPTLGEITYQAFEIPNIEFHCDLYGAIQEKYNLNKIEEVETWLEGKGYTRDVRWSEGGKTKSETRITSIRNKIHHPDNQSRPSFSETELKDSINMMIGLL